MTDLAEPHPPGSRLNIGVVCYPTIGGSGVVATEIGLAMADRGHRVYFVCYDTPRRFEPRDRVFFHNVVVPSYPVFHHEPYTLALASKLVEVSRWQDLDIIHVHYALPHAASAFLARSVLGDESPKIVTTVHGTDVTLVGSDASYLPITRFSLEQSDAVTAPSRFLEETTRVALGLNGGAPIDVIPNFVDSARFAPAPLAGRARVAGLFAQSAPRSPLPDDAPVLIHVSNFRPVKRVDDVVSIFAGVAARSPARLLMVGDGPDRSRAEARVRELGLRGRVRFLGSMDRVVDMLQGADLMLLPSASESFGLVALEAAACGVPVVASLVGGLPEVVVDGETGRLVPPGDVASFVDAALDLIQKPERRRAMGQAARERAVAHFGQDAAIDRYEAVYRRVLGSAPVSDGP